MGPVGRTVFTHYAIAGITDTANDVVLENRTFVRHVAVRVGNRDDAVFLLDFAFDSLLRGGFFAAHIVAVSVAVACNLVTILGQIAETAPVGVPVHYQVEGGLVSVLVEQRTRIAHMARCAVVKRERNGALAETRPSGDFDRTTETTGHRDTDRLPCHLVSRDLISIGLRRYNINLASQQPVDDITVVERSRVSLHHHTGIHLRLGHHFQRDIK